MLQDPEGTTIAIGGRCGRDSVDGAAEAAVEVDDAEPGIGCVDAFIDDVAEIAFQGCCGERRRGGYDEAFGEEVIVQVVSYGWLLQRLWCGEQGQ